MKKPCLFLALVLLVISFPGAAGASHWERYIGPGEPTREFPKDFMPLLPKDKQAKAELNPWDDPRIGGWGSDECPADHEPRVPVVFVHGNGGHAGHFALEGSEPKWVNIRQEFLDAGYCPRELWAISYDGAGGYSTYHKVNVGEVWRFIQAVRAYLDVPQVDIVGHSLGVTMIRQVGFLHPELYRQMRRFVAIAGANDGTTTCRGSEEVKGSLHVCDEIGPGRPWLDRLNAFGETPPGPEYLTIYDGTGVADDFFLGPDALSPRLEGACNHPMPGLDHFSLAWSPEPVEIYLAFLQDGDLPSCE